MKARKTSAGMRRTRSQMARDVEHAIESLEKLEADSYYLRSEAVELLKRQTRKMQELDELREEVEGVLSGVQQSQQTIDARDKLAHTLRLLESIKLSVDVVRDRSQEKAKQEMEERIEFEQEALETAFREGDLSKAEKVVQDIELARNACDPEPVGASDHRIESILGGCCREDRVEFRKRWKEFANEAKTKLEHFASTKPKPSVPSAQVPASAAAAAPPPPHAENPEKPEDETTSEEEEEDDEDEEAMYREALRRQQEERMFRREQERRLREQQALREERARREEQALREQALRRQAARERAQYPLWDDAGFLAQQPPRRTTRRQRRREHMPSVWDDFW